LGNFRRAVGKKFRDFRNKDKPDETYGGGDGTAYVARLKMPDYGSTKPGKSADDNLKGKDKDFVKVEIAGIRFRAYIEELTDGVSTSWSDIKYSGSPYVAKTFGASERSFSLKIAVPAFTSGELKTNYTKLNKLMRKCMPKMIGGVASGQFHYLTVGDIFSNIPIILTDVTPEYLLDGWDISHGEGKETAKTEKPMHFKIAVAGTILGDAAGKTIRSTTEFFG